MCVGNATGCDVSIRIYEEFVPLVRGDLQAAQPLFAVPFVYDFMISTFDNATHAIEAGLSNLDNADFGLADFQLNIILAVAKTLGTNVGPLLYGAVSSLLSAFNAAVDCTELNFTQNSCPDIMKFFAGLLQLFEKYIRQWLSAIPGLNTLITNPILAVFDQVSNDLLTENVATFTDSMSILIGGLQFLNKTVAPLLPEPTRTQMTNATQGMLRVPPLADACVGATDPCMGTYEVGAAFLQGAITNLRSLPAIGTTGTAFFNAADQLVAALKTGATATIQTAVNAIQAPLNALASIPGVGSNAVFQAVQSTVNNINTCVNNTTTP
ncbi:hypothetical protein DFQ27_006187 [Actinomortierella ambigua]|uniref:Uncharacterized protein n=1 Tax=Actinomortierella ambigua TaxID=1343610 RepID=A0A9P6U1V3_9FUNG|nr:hypothetical protein DFQ27_006187 [Actinomortierella ambigua]